MALLLLIGGKEYLPWISGYLKTTTLFTVGTSTTSYFFFKICGFGFSASRVHFRDAIFI